MARTVGKLTALRVERLKKPGLYSDGAGLYLQVTGDGEEHIAKSWVYRYMLRGKAREMGLGSLTGLGLAEARAEIAKWHRVRQSGIDPIEARKAEQARAALDAATAVIFKDCAANYIKAHRDGWRNAKHAAQWETTLETYAEPVIGALPVSGINTALVLQVLEPVWKVKTETASRVRQRMEAILDWAKVHGYRDGENPARWKGHLDKLLPERSKLRRVKHHPALPYDELPSFIAELQQQKGLAARALEFAILTAARTGEVVGAKHAEIKTGVWTIPAERMKAGRISRSRIWRCSNCSGGWGATPSRCTVFVRRSAIGLLSARASRTSSPKWPWPMRPRASRVPIAAAISSTSGAN